MQEQKPSRSAALTVIKTKGTAARWGESGAGEPWVTSPSALFFCSFLFFSFPCRGRASPPVPGFYSQRLGPFNAWDTQKQKNKEKVREPKRGRDGGSESSLFGWSSDQIRLFSDQACSSMRLESYPPPPPLTTTTTTTALLTPPCKWEGAKWQGWLSLFYHGHTCLHARIPHGTHKVTHAKTNYF